MSKYLNPAATPCHPESIALGGGASAEAEYDDDYDSMTVAELDQVIDNWELDIAKSLNKAEKIAALRAADAEE